jgi:hypothetical protein
MKDERIGHIPSPLEKLMKDKSRLTERTEAIELIIKIASALITVGNLNNCNPGHIAKTIVNAIFDNSYWPCTNPECINGHVFRTSVTSESDKIIYGDKCVAYDKCSVCHGIGQGSKMFAIKARDNEPPHNLCNQQCSEADDFNEGYLKAIEDLTTPHNGTVFAKVLTEEQ